MNLMEAMHARRAVRAYTPQMVDDATIRNLLRAAVLAPSAMNRQPWLFSIVQDVARLRRYSDVAKQMLLDRMANDPKTGHYLDLLHDPKFNIFYDASTLIVISAVESSTYAEADCWLAAQNLLLAATEAGLGSCCIGFAIPALNSDELRDDLGLPAAALAVAPIIIGYPSATPRPVPRNDPRIVTWRRGHP